MGDHAPPLPLSHQAQQDETIRYSREEWEQHRAVIQGMYPLKGMNLKGIVAFLREDRGFVVNERQLKRKINDWKLGKNVKSHEMIFIARKTQQRAAIGKNTIFRVRGKSVEPSKIERWEKRCGDVFLNDTPASIAISSVPSTPSDVSYDTTQEGRSPLSHPWNTTSFGMMNVDMEKIVAPSPVFPSQASVLISSRNAPDGDLIGTPMDGELFEERGPSLIPSLQALKNEPPAPEESQKAPKFTFANGDFAIESKSYMENSPSIHNIQKKRYKQMQELELSGRLDDLRFKYGENHPATIDTAIRLSGVLSDQGRYRSAELLLKQCEECLQQSVGENNKITLVTSSKLAHCFVQQGQLSKAEKLFTEVYLRASQFSTPSDPMFLVMKMDFANCIAHLGNSAGAEQELREVLNVGRGFLPVDDHILLTCVRYLAEVLKLRSKFCEAEKILLDLMQAEARGETADCLRTRALLGDVYRLKGKFQQAERTLREVQEAQQQLLGSEHDQTLITERTLVLILRDLRRFDESEKLLRESIERSIKVLGIKHRLTFEQQAILADILNQQQKFSEAAEIATRALATCEEIYGSTHEITCLTAMILSGSYRHQGQLEEALTTILGACEGYTQSLGPDHAMTKECRRRIIQITRELKQLGRP